MLQRFFGYDGCHRYVAIRDDDERARQARCRQVDTCIMEMEENGETTVTNENYMNNNGFFSHISLSFGLVFWLY